MEIELVALRIVELLAYLCKAHCPERGNAKHRSELCRRRADRHLSVMVEKPLQCRGRAIERHVELLAHDCDGHVDVFYARQDIGDQIALFETG